ncbi:CwfJ C-terminus 1-domain-containing protein-like protein [Dipodascopsis tothii]|uniref:CwfJ C-terminus 1-domain-containing protein-like protein n=1 Tax=Dipodascopsis tothii TaxID=44089 RepID=UPI0034CFA066
MKAAYMRAKLRRAPDADQLERDYHAALAAATGADDAPDTVEVVSLMHTRGAPATAKDDADMTIADMVAEEKRTRGQWGGAGRALADRIGRDSRFKDDLDYLDENAERLAARTKRTDVDLRAMAIDDVRRMDRILDECPLCQSEHAEPLAPIVALGTRVFLTLPTVPELSPRSATIVPIAHRRCTLECDDEEWDEIRNFMKCLVRMYDDANMGVLFYENAAAAGRRRHAAIEAVPVPYDLAATAPAYFREAILAADEEWTQHRKLIDTLARARSGLGRAAFRQSLVKEVQYFHVWFTVDGGYGHVVEDVRRWPAGDLFARETIGGMLQLPPNVIKRQGTWTAESRADPRVRAFAQQWAPHDWTAALVDAAAEATF